jgi:pimeloyl-ACP methyl ester carboxylesterase
MVAALLWLLLALELAVWGLAGSALVGRGALTPMQAVIAAAAAAALLRAALVGLTFALTRPPMAGLGAVRAARLLAGEWRAFSLLFTVLQPLQPLLVPPRPRPGGSGPAVVLVHGIYCNAGVWWAMARALRRAGVTRLYAINLEPPYAGVEDFAVRLRRELAAVAADTGGAPVTLVVHSMGGLVARRCLQRFGAGGVRKVVSIGSPYAGSRLARIALGACGADLRPGSPLLRRLEAGGAPAAPAVSIFSPHDNFVAPQASPVLPPPAVNYAVAGRGHLALLLDADVAGRVVLEVLAPAATDGSRA